MIIMTKIYKFSIFFSIIIMMLVWSLKIFATEENNTWYNLYQSRNQELCNVYEADKPIFSKENDYQNLWEIVEESWNNYNINWNDLDRAKQEYKDTMNSIYKCALLNVQERSILSILEKSELSTTVNKKEYTAKLDRLKSARIVNNCVNANNSLKVNDQKNVIDQTTYELCKYNNYLEYLLEYNSIVANVLEQDKLSNNTPNATQISETYNITDIINIEEKKKNDILDEIEKAYEIYPIAYQAYSEYENNFPIHDLLGLLQSDFVEYRLELHKNINPINQVVYKISNATKE